jgi:hypothetical protein
MELSVTPLLRFLSDTLCLELLITSFATGIASHAAFFVHGELNYLAQIFFLSLFLVPVALFAVLFLHVGISLAHSLITTGVL